MRKWTLLYVVVLFVVMAAPAGARRVINEGDSGFEVAAYVGQGATASNGRIATDGQGWASASENQNGAGFGMEYWLYFGCDDVSEGDDPVLFLESVSAWGNGSITDFVIDPRNGPDKFMLGHAVGTFEEGSLSYVYCDEPGWELDLAGVNFEIHMDGVGYVYKTSDSESFHIPGVQNDHYRWRGEYRQSYGWVDLGVANCADPCTFSTDGGIGKWSYSSHGNSH